MKGRKPEIRQEHVQAVTFATPPVWLADEAKAEWNRVMPVLVDRRILTEADLGSFENYCISVGRVRLCEAKIQKEKDPEMMLKLVRMQDKSMGTARQLAAELGLTPVSRSRPAVREDESKDDSISPLDL